MNQRTPAVSVRNVTKRFGPVLANDKVCLDVHRGEILALLGENGSGKTTLMNMLSGIYFPDEGEIFINGKPVSITSPKESFRLGIGPTSSCCSTAPAATPKWTVPTSSSSAASS